MPDAVLDYALSPETGIARRRWWLAFIFGATVGYIVALVLFGVLRAGGPIFPMTVLFAPIAVFVEWIPTQSSTLALELEAGGPLLYGLYAVLPGSRNRWRNVSIAVAAHTLCFLITLWQRDVL